VTKVCRRCGNPKTVARNGVPDSRCGPCQLESVRQYAATERAREGKRLRSRRYRADGKYKKVWTPEQLELHKASQREFRATPEGKRRSRGYYLKHKYGITIDEFDSLFIRQGRSCAICRRQQSDASGWHLDHDHITGAIRSILCGSCNQGLGLFGDSVGRLLLAADYIRKHRPEVEL
jgi:hypothetical protein